MSIIYYTYYIFVIVNTVKMQFFMRVKGVVL